MAQDPGKGQRNFIVAVLLVLGFLFFLYLSRRVVVPFFVAFAFAYLLDPLADRLESWKLSRTFSVLVIMLVFFLLAAGGLLLLYPLFRVQAENLTRNFPQYLQVVEEWLRPLLQEIEGLDQAQVRDILNQGFSQFGELPLKIVSSVTTFVWDSISGLFDIFLMLANLVIIPLVMFYLLRDFDSITERLLNLVPPRHRDKTVEIVREIDRVLANFVRGQLMVALLMGLLYSIGLFLCGTPMSLFIGFVAGLANLVPYLGVVVGFLPAALLTYLQTQDWLPILGIAAVFGLVQALEGLVLSPRILGETVGLHPVAVILAVLLGGELFGLVGIILGVPAVAILNVLLARGLIEYKKTPFFSSG